MGTLKLNIAAIVFILFTLLSEGLVAQKTKDMTKTIYIQNKDIEIRVDHPLANYNFSRFDWTGKIVAVKYKGISVSGIEKMNADDDNSIGKGFYNEFGIDKPIAFDETAEGGWFHKIGIGTIQRKGKQYDFKKKYKIQPADFEISVQKDKVIISCIAPEINGYAYVLTKTIALLDDGFEIGYRLKNTGKKRIITNEYSHNFLAIDKRPIGKEYLLNFTFNLDPEKFNAIVNPEDKVDIGSNEITFKGTPSEQFFLSNLSGSKTVKAAWELINTKNNIGIRETGSFETSTINLWGWQHVISPELFFEIDIQPGEDIEWFRKYTLFDID